MGTRSRIVHPLPDCVRSKLVSDVQGLEDERALTWTCCRTDCLQCIFLEIHSNRIIKNYSSDGESVTRRESGSVAWIYRDADKRMEEAQSL